ncbi:MAG: signal recognition particle receptor subunit alpha, partial [Bacteroidota bacterium]
MFQNLSTKLEKAVQSLKGQSRISDVNIAETVREIRRALLDADVHFDVAKEITDSIQEEALGQDVLTSVNPGQQFTKIVHDHLVRLLGGETVGLAVADTPPTVILIAGLQGSGKTTFAGKLAKFLKNKHGKNPLLVAGDVYRPAAINQLQVVGEQVQVPVYTEDGNKDPVKIAKAAVKQAVKEGNDLVILDTAGRLAIDEQMMNEVASIKKAVAPHETLFVVDSMTGQDAVNTARE